MLALAVIFGASEVETRPCDDHTRRGVTLLGAAIGVAAPMLVGLTVSSDRNIGTAAGGVLGIVISAPLLALLANRLAGGRASAGVTLVSGWLSLFPSVPLLGLGAGLGSAEMAPPWASSTLVAAGALVAAAAIMLIIDR